MRTVPKLILVAVVVPMIFGFVYFGMANSEAMDAAKVAVAQAPAVVEKVGPVQKTRLAMLGSSLSWSGPEGEATLYLVVHGGRGTTRVRVEMRKALGAWTVTDMGQ